MEVFKVFIRAISAQIGQSVGEAVIADVYEVVAQDDRGRRWVHQQAWPTVEYNHEASCEVGEPVYTIIKRAEQNAQEVADQVDAAGVIDLQYWSETIAEYGSAAHNEADLYDEDDKGAIRAAGGIVA